jgi:hypothetical protein
MAATTQSSTPKVGRTYQTDALPGVTVTVTRVTECWGGPAVYYMYSDEPGVEWHCSRSSWDADGMTPAPTPTPAVSYLDALRASVQLAELRCWTKYLTAFGPSRREAWAIAYERLAALREELGAEAL